jgi:Metallo-peptidase family M12B Reprolysin-like
MQPVEPQSSMTDPAEHNREILFGVYRNQQFLKDHQFGGYDITITLAHFGNKYTGNGGCGGGIAFVTTVSSNPFGVVDFECLRNGHTDVFTHEVAHLFGAGHDHETAEGQLKTAADKAGQPPQALAYGEHYGFRVCDVKEGLGKPRRTIMSYSCKNLPALRRIMHFSCALYKVGGLSIGYEALDSTSYGANNCAINNKSVAAMGAFATTNKLLAARQKLRA